LAYDGAGTPTAAFYNETEQSVEVSARVAGVWTPAVPGTEIPMGTVQSFGARVAVAFVGSERRVVSSVSPAPGGRAAVLDVSGDEPLEIGTLAAEPREVALLVGEDGGLHLLALGFRDSLYGKWDDVAKAWTVETDNLGLGEENIFITQWTVDRAGRIHVTYDRTDEFISYYRVREGGVWSEREALGDKHATLRTVGLTIADDGTAHAVYQKGVKLALLYAERRAEGWVEESLPGKVINSLGRVRLHVGPDGTVHVAHDGSPPSGSLAYFYKHSGGEWIGQYVGEPGVSEAPRHSWVVTPSGGLAATYAVFQDGSIHMAQQSCQP